MKRGRQSLKDDRTVKPKYDIAELNNERALLIAHINTEKQRNADKINTKVYLDENNILFVVVPNLRYSGRDIIKIGLEFPVKLILKLFIVAQNTKHMAHLCLLMG